MEKKTNKLRGTKIEKKKGLAYISWKYYVSN